MSVYFELRPPNFVVPSVTTQKEESMTEKDENNDKKEMRMMWIITAVVVLAILGMMGLNMLTDPDWRHGYRGGASAEVTK